MGNLLWWQNSPEFLFNRETSSAGAASSEDIVEPTLEVITTTEAGSDPAVSSAGEPPVTSGPAPLERGGASAFSSETLPPDPVVGEGGSLPPDQAGEIRQLLVRWQPGASLSQRDQALAATGATRLRELHTTVMQRFGQGVLEVIELPPGLSLERAMEIYARRPGVEVVEVNQILSIEATTANDTSYANGLLWGMYSEDMPAVGPEGTTNAYGSRAEVAWATGGVGESSTVLGVLDSGIDYTHEDLYLNIWLNQGEIRSLSFFDSLTDVDADGLITFRDLNDAANAAFVRDGTANGQNRNGRIDAGDLLADSRWVDGLDNEGNGYVDDLIGWDFVNNDNDPYDDNRHGTHVAGTAGGIGGNDLGVAGVNWSLQMVPLKFLGANGTGSLDAAVAALDYYADATLRYDRSSGGEADYVGTNNSWGGGGYSTTLYEAIRNGAQLGNLFIAAAGNSASDNDLSPAYPASYSTMADLGWDAVVAVASISSDGTLSGFSSYGATSVDLAAPGSNIWSTLPGNTYGTLSGTSMATPHVSGALALYASLYPDATPEQLLEALYASTTATASLSGLTSTGGRLDVGGMIAPIRVRLLSAPVTSESGGTVTLEVSLAQQPTADVLLPLSSTDTSEGVLSVSELRFTAANWNQPQQVTVTGVNDALFDADQLYGVAFGPAISADPFFSGQDRPDLMLRNLDDEAELSGRVWFDADADGLRDAGEGDLAGATVFVDADGDGQLDAGEVSTVTGSSGQWTLPVLPGSYQVRLLLPEGYRQTTPVASDGDVDPDGFAAGAVLNDVDPNITLTAVGTGVSGGAVTAASTRFSSTGGLAFASGWNGGVWDTGVAELRIDFRVAVTQVQIDFISDDGLDRGHLRAFDANGVLLGEYRTADLGTGVKETMTISRPTADIAYVLASGRNGQHGWLDNLRYTVRQEGEALPLRLSVAGGERLAGNDFGVVADAGQPPASDPGASQPTLSFKTVAVEMVEGLASSVILTVELNQASASEVRVSYATADGTARAGTDYTATSGVLSFAPGQTSLTISVPVTADGLNEADETFTVSLSGASGAQLGSSSAATVTITDTLRSAVNTDLPEGVANLLLTGTDPISGGGNAGDNTITGNDAANTLWGGGGVDLLIGGAGNDIYDLRNLTQAADRDTIAGFQPQQQGDRVWLSAGLTDSGSPSAPPDTASVSQGSSITLDTGSAQLFLLNYDNTEAGVDLAADTSGATLLDGLRPDRRSASLRTSSRGGRGYLLAYDNGNGYLYHFDAGGNSSLAPNEIQLIATFDNDSAIEVGSLGGADFVLM